MAELEYFIGVDVGTGSVRAGLFDKTGEHIQSFERTIQTQHLAEDFYEQSSEEIWKAVSQSIRKILEESRIDASKVKGVGFAATCSLVCLDSFEKPVGVSPYNTDDNWNIILWMDHRAMPQAERITATGHRVLKYFGNTISPENELPKILWIKQNLNSAWKRIAHFMDLCDFLTFRATHSVVRSLCPLVCKSGYLASNQQRTEEQKTRHDDTSGWDESLLRCIGLDDLVTEGFCRLGAQVASPGTPLGKGLSEAAALDLGLLPGTSVGSSMVDAHGGGVGILGANLKETVSNDCSNSLSFTDLEERLAMIAGTSTCFMASSLEPIFVSGVWGPYYSAMIPNMWLSEGGESATGKLVEFIVTNHCQYPNLVEMAAEKGIHVYELLNFLVCILSKENHSTPEQLVSLVKSTDGAKIQHDLNEFFGHLQLVQENKTESDTTAYKRLELTKNLHLLPYFHGNRAPYADPTLRGMISGLGMDNSIAALAKLYFATLQSLCYGAKHLVQVMNDSGHRIKFIYLCGGGMASNKLFLEQLADCIGYPVIIPKQNQYAVMRGAAMLGAVASQAYSSLPDAMVSMSKVQQVIYPHSVESSVRKFHDQKFKVFLKMHSHQIEYRSIMNQIK
eukprot:jgi/Galph1/4511/GphlegSOOS_G3136.1